MPQQPARWLDLVSHPSLAVVLDLDDTLLSEKHEQPLDRGFALLLEALHGVGVHVVFVSLRPLQLAGRVHDQAPHAEWIAKRHRPMCEIISRLRSRGTELRVIAIGDHSADATLFEALAPDERAMSVRLGNGRRPSAVRAMLWWLVETRRGGNVHLLS